MEIIEIENKQKSVAFYKEPEKPAEIIDAAGVIAFAKKYKINTDSEKLRERLQMIQVPYQKETEIKYFNDFKAWTSNIIRNTNTFKKFLNYLTYPLPIVDFMQQTKNALSRVFSATDKKSNIQIDTKIEDDAKKQYYLNFEFIEKYLFENYLINPNNILVLRKTNEESGEGELQYVDIEFFNVNFENVKAIEIKNGKIEKIYIESGDFAVFIDGSKYLYFNGVGTNIKLIAPDIHGLGHAPVYFFSNEILENNSPLYRTNIYVNHLFDIFHLFLALVFKKFSVTDSFAPVKQIIKGNGTCTYETETRKCDGEGTLLVKKEDDTMYYSNPLEFCPKCSQDIGAGAVIKVPVISTPNGDVQIKETVKYLSPEVDILKYGDDYKRISENDLFEAITGITEDLSRSVAHNETAYKSNNRTQENVLQTLSKVFNGLVKNVLEDTYRLRYGADLKNIEIQYSIGNIYDLTDMTTLYGMSKTAAEIKMSGILPVNKEIINRSYRNDTDRKKQLLLYEFTNGFDPLLPNPPRIQAIACNKENFVVWCANENFNSKEELNKLFDKYLQFHGVSVNDYKVETPQQTTNNKQ